MPAIEVTMPSGAPGGRERRALLDVRLDEAGGRGLEPAASWAARRSRARRTPRRARRRRRRADRPRRPRACRRARGCRSTPPPKRGPSSSRKAMAASVRRGGPPAAIASAASSASERAERAVEAPAVGRRVEMRAAPDLGQLGLAAAQPPGRGCRPRRTRPRAPPRASSRRRARTRAARPGRGPGGSCPLRGRSRRARRGARGCAGRAPPERRTRGPPTWIRAACSLGRVCQGPGALPVTRLARVRRRHAAVDVEDVAGALARAPVRGEVHDRRGDVLGQDVHAAASCACGSAPRARPARCRRPRRAPRARTSPRCPSPAAPRRD